MPPGKGLDVVSPPEGGRRISPYRHLTASSSSSNGSSQHLSILQPPFAPHHPDLLLPSPTFSSPVHPDIYTLPSPPLYEGLGAPAPLFYAAGAPLPRRAPSGGSSRKCSLSSLFHPGEVGPAPPKYHRQISVPTYQNNGGATVNYYQIPSLHHLKSYNKSLYTYENEVHPGIPRVKASRSKKHSVPALLPSTLERRENRRRSSHRSDEDNRRRSSQRISEEEAGAPEKPGPPIPTFTFSSSDLPLGAPPFEDVVTNSGSASDSTPQFERSESKQMIKSEARNDTSSRIFESASIRNNIFARSRPSLMTQDREKPLCANCSKCDDAVSVAPSLTVPHSYAPRPPRPAPLLFTCDTLLSLTIVLAAVILVFIAAFIVYVETVQKQPQIYDAL